MDTKSDFESYDSSCPQNSILLLPAQADYGVLNRFRHEQLNVIKAALQGRDVSVLWATGCGKSLCYQLPAFYSCSTVMVVSPLISLMNDQVFSS